MKNKTLLTSAAAALLLAAAPPIALAEDRDGSAPDQPTSAKPGTGSGPGADGSPRHTDAGQNAKAALKQGDEEIRVRNEVGTPANAEGVTNMEASGMGGRTSNASTGVGNEGDPTSTSSGAAAD